MKKEPTELFLRTSQIPNSFYNFLNTNLTTYSETERHRLHRRLCRLAPQTRFPRQDVRDFTPPFPQRYVHEKRREESVRRGVCGV